ncbi:MAG: LysR family transcriptional regulator [Rhodovibrionaceae bacterium]
MTTQLDIRHLALLLALIEAPSMTVAAERLGLTQSALSHRLREAERRLDVALFFRDGRRLRPTEAGERLALTARRLLSELAAAEAVAMGRKGSERQTAVRVGQGLYSAAGWFPDFVALTAARAADLRPILAGDAGDEPLKDLLAGEIDLALVPGDSEAAGVDRRAVFGDRLVAVLPRGHALLAKSYLEAADFAGETFLAYGYRPLPGFEYEQLMRPAETYPGEVLRVGPPEVVAGLVARGFGVSVLSRWMLRPFLREGRIAVRRLTAQGLPLTWYAAVRSRDAPDAGSRRLAELLAAWGAGAETQPPPDTGASGR